MRRNAVGTAIVFSGANSSGRSLATVPLPTGGPPQVATNGSGYLTNRTASANREPSLSASGRSLATVIVLDATNHAPGNCGGLIGAPAQVRNARRRRSELVKERVVVEFGEGVVE